MSLKVGDKVRIKNNVGECTFGCNISMEKYVGKTATITDIYCGDNIKLDIDGRFWVWSENVLELIENKEEIVNDVVNHPSHYTDGKIEVMDFIEDKQLNFARGNVIKYVARAGKKDKNKELEDLRKAMWYLNREIERLEKEKK